MNIIELYKENKLKAIQLDVMFLIFAVFFLNVFITISPWIFYALMVLVVANLVLGVINKKGRIFMNIILLILAGSLFLFLLGYFGTIIGTIVSGIYFFVDIFTFFRKEEIVVKKKKKKN